MNKGVRFSAQTDSGIAIFVALYGFACLFGVNKGLAVTEFVKYLGVLAIYLASKTVAKEEGGKTAILFAIVLVTGVSSVISLLTAAGVVNYPAAYSTSEIEKWLKPKDNRPIKAAMYQIEPINSWDGFFYLGEDKEKAKEIYNQIG
jgi:hypothetical protein